MEPLTIVLLCLLFSLVGLTWGWLACFYFVYMPLRKKHKEFLDLASNHADSMIKQLNDILDHLPVRVDGSMVSPIQIKTAPDDETN